MDVGVAAWFAAIALAFGVCSRSLERRPRAWWWLAGAIGLLAAAAAVVRHSFVSIVLLDAAELASAGLLWIGGTPGTRRAARACAWAIVPGIACTLVAAAILGSADEPFSRDLQRLAVDLLIVGFAIKLGLLPFWFWLPAVAADAPTMSAAIVIALVDIAAFVELAGLREAAPWIFTQHADAWMAIALLSTIAGAVLALAQRELKRMVAFSTVAELGLLLIAVIVGGVGLSAASIGALNHALCKVVLFGAIGVAEQRCGRKVTLDTRGLANAMPLASAAFVIGAFGLFAVPPGLGFVGYARLYTAIEQFGGPMLIAFVGTVAALDLSCYARAICRAWYGSARVQRRSRQPAHFPGAVLEVSPHEPRAAERRLDEARLP